MNDSSAKLKLPNQQKELEMKTRILLITLSVLVLAGGAIATTAVNTSHTHDEPFGLDIKNGHSGRTDSSGGHNCSDASVRKGLCSGYHYH